MTKKLSSSFFGDKKLIQKIYETFQQNEQLTSDDLSLIFEPYTSKLSGIKSQDGACSLFDIFIEFIQAVINQYGHWQFQKFTSVVQISAHVFQHSFENWLTKEQSFKYFSDVIVRHSLFRPPHSVCVFNHDEMTEITTFWINHFHRYYECYQQCFASNLNQILFCHPLPQEPTFQLSLKDAKVIDKQHVLNLLK